jgi:peptidoglycan/xylan/chitin deacetylase (PgdA/CDA1 family)
MRVMNPLREMGSVVCEVLYKLNETRVLPFPHNNGGCIFTLHSIISDHDFLPKENNHVSVSFLEQAIQLYRRKSIDILTLDEALLASAKDSTRPYVCFTFDDGYLDNATLALPMFRKYSAPMTIFVTSATLDRDLEDYWWGQLRHVVMENDELEGEEINAKLPACTEMEKGAAYNHVAMLIKTGALPSERAQLFFSRYGVTPHEALNRDCLSEGDVRCLARTEPLVQIGAHSTNHAPLAMLDAKVAENDIVMNKVRLENLTCREVRHFAYPYGDRRSCGMREFEMVRAAGFASGVTTIDGNVRREHLERRWSIPRRRVLGTIERLGVLECQRAGLLDIPIAVLRGK